MRDGVRSDGPSGPVRELILERVIQMFGAARWDIPDDFLQRSHYLRALGKLDWTSSPGYPYMRRAPTNGDLFKVKNGIPNELIVDQFWELVNNRIRDGDSDYIRLFVKPEPHKLGKLRDGRYRLISSVSVLDQIIDHMLFDQANDRLIDNWLEVPSKIGWSPVWGGWRVIPTSGCVALDKSSWDWTVQLWLVELVLELRARLCSNLSADWLRLAKWRYQQLYCSPSFITSGGLVMRQVTPGVMKSGCVNTISDNSFMQCILHVRVCLEIDVSVGNLICMGDDTLQETIGDIGRYLDRMSQYARVKSPVYNSEFAGFRFHGRRIEPLYKGKHAYVLLHVDPEVLPQLSQSYLLMYHRSAYRDLMEDLFLKMGQELTTRRKRDLIYNGY